MALANSENPIEANQCYEFLSKQAHELALSKYKFPAIGRFFIFERLLRIAIHEAFEGLDFYTGLPLDFDYMSIDHILPKKLGGPDSDNFFNYVPTTGQINYAKGHSFEHSDIENLKQVQEIYAPRVLALLKLYGAFENRDEDYAKAVIASTRRSTYRYPKRETKPSPAVATIPAALEGRKITYRRTIDKPDADMLELISLMSKELSKLSDTEFARVMAQKYFQFSIQSRTAPIIDFNDKMTFSLYLSQRKHGAKLSDDILRFQTQLFAVTDYSSNPRNNRINVTVDFHPLFALKLLEAPAGRAKTIEFLLAFFRASDIVEEEFMDWSR